MKLSPAAGDSFMVGVACEKNWGGGSQAVKPKSLKSGVGLEHYAYVSYCSYATGQSIADDRQMFG